MSELIATSRNKPKNGLPKKVKDIAFWSPPGVHLDPKVIPTDPKVATKENTGGPKTPKCTQRDYFGIKNSNVLDLPQQAKKRASKQSQVHAPFGGFWNPFGSQSDPDGPQSRHKGSQRTPKTPKDTPRESF